MYVLLTVDLNRVTDEQRELFAEQRAELQWEKTSLTTTWVAAFTEDTDEDDALRASAEDVETAAAYAQIARYEYAIQAGRELPVVDRVGGGLRGRPR